MLEDYGLVRKIGPSSRSGLYEITQRGKLALDYQDCYTHNEDFEELLDIAESDDGQDKATSSSVNASSLHDESDDQTHDE